MNAPKDKTRKLDATRPMDDVSGVKPQSARTREVVDKPAWSEEPATKVDGPRVSWDVKSRDDLELGLVVDGRYRIADVIGRGGMGVVYAAVHVRTERRVALKVLLTDVAEGGEAFHRFELEAKAAARIGSEHIIDVLDFGQLEDGTPYMVMEMCEGESLAERLRESGPMAPQAIAKVMVQMLEGLAPAHAAGIVHRDLKPGNIFLLSEQPGRSADFVKILDFGISKIRGESKRHVTIEGRILGTPTYMAPEQARGDASVDHRADIYAAGVILYRGISGSRPFRGETELEYFEQLMTAAPTPLSQVSPTIDPALEEIVHRALAHDREERFQSVGEMATALRTWLAPKPKPVERAGPRRVVGWALTIVLALASLGALGLGGLILLLHHAMPVSNITLDDVKVPTTTMARVDGGVCLLEEMSSADGYCVVPVVREHDETARQVFAAIVCSELDDRFGPAAVSNQTPSECDLFGNWKALEDADGPGANALRKRYPNPREPALVVTAHSSGLTTIAVVLLILGTLFAAAAWFLGAGLRRRSSG